MSVLNRLVKIYFPMVFLSILFTGCATIFGGTRYNAHIMVENHPKAKILFAGTQLGEGQATIKIPRKDANNFSFKIKESGCEEQKFNFKRRKFRGWTLAVSIPSWTVNFSGAPISIPVGIMVDLAGNVFWKPDENEKYVSKIDYNNFNYTVNYTGCKVKESNKIDFIDGPYLEH